MALRQAEEVSERLRHIHCGLETELVVIKTTGDKVLDAPLAKIGSKGVFVKEIEEALLEGRIDLAVHSMKDLPSKLPEGLIVGAVPEREDPRDVLISRDGLPFEALPEEGRVGTSSLRRRVQLRRILPRWEVLPLRGNLDTRLRRLQEGRFDAIVVAAAGLKRLGLVEFLKHPLPPEVMLPAAGQGALAVECREGDPLTDLLQGIHHPQTALEVAAERAFLQRMGGGCQVPMGALARFDEGEVCLKAMVSSLEGDRLFAGEEKGRDPERVGTLLADRLLEKGAREVLEEVYSRDG